VVFETIGTTAGDAIALLLDRLAAEQSQSRAQDEGQLEAVRRKIASLIRAIEDGLYQLSMKTRMAELEAEKAALEERLAAAPELPKGAAAPEPRRGVPGQGGTLEQALADPWTRPRPWRSCAA
jgi:site-specific DNA recombinase